MSKTPPNLPPSFSLTDVKLEDPLKVLADNFSNLKFNVNPQASAQKPLTLIAMMQEHHKNTPPRNRFFKR